MGHLPYPTSYIQHIVACISLDASTRIKAVVHYANFNRSIRKIAALYKVPKSSLQRLDFIKKLAYNDATANQDRCVLFYQGIVHTNPFVTSYEIAEMSL